MPIVSQTALPPKIAGTAKMTTLSSRKLRHRFKMTALESLRAAREAMLLGVTPDAVLTEAEEAMAAIGELTGASIREDITNRIFARFCVGK